MGRSQRFTVQIGITSYVVTAERERADRSTGEPERCEITSATQDGVELPDGEFEELRLELEAGWLLARAEDECEARWEAQIGGAL
jgi:hypothetical protein